jgi:hypothetical protein
LVDYAGIYLVKHNGVLTSKLSPLPNQPEIKVKAKLPHRSPWRVMMISDRVGALIESNPVKQLFPGGTEVLFLTPLLLRPTILKTINTILIFVPAMELNIIL